jgi:hypothetical protein
MQMPSRPLITLAGFKNETLHFIIVEEEPKLHIIPVTL